MKVTPLDIRRKEFKRSVRGYLDEEVDVFLDTVADEVDRVSKINTELESKVRGLEEQVASHTHIREALEKTLVAAQLQSEEIRSNAEKESQSMLKQAEAKAKAVVDDLYAQARSVQQTLMQLKLLEEDFRFKFKGMLEGYMKLVEEGPVLASVPESESPGSEGAGRKASGGTPPSSVVTGDREVEADPTSDVTEESAGAGANDKSARASTPPAPLPPSLPKNRSVKRAQADTDEDATVEVAFAAEPQGSSVYFGKQENEDLDDPFPEIGGDSQKPRDFAW